MPENYAWHKHVLDLFLFLVNSNKFGVSVMESDYYSLE